MDFVTIIGIAASACTATSLLPQLIKIIKEKKAEAVSYGMIAVLFGGLALWIWYGIKKDDLVIVVANTVSLLINTALGVLTIKYKK